MSFNIPAQFLNQFFLSVAMNLMQIFVAYTLTLYLFQKERMSLLRIIITTAFFYLTSILVFLTFLGAFYILYLKYLFLLVLLFFIASLYFYWLFMKKKARLMTLKKRLYFPNEAKNVFFWAFIGVILFVVLVKYFVASLQIVTESDSLVYHMPFVARWFQLGHIWEPYFTAYAGPLGYYPSNYELFLMWFVMPFHSDVLVNLVNFFLYPFFFILFYLVLRQFSVRSDLALLMTFVGTCIPVLLRQLGMPQNDLFFMLFFLYSIYFWFSFLRHQKGLYLGLLGLALGVFFGTKYTGVPGALPLFIFSLASVFYVSFKAKNALKALVKYLPLFVLLFLVGGAFWYLRNFINTGNPFFPIDVHVLGFTLFDGYKGLTEKVFEEALVSHIGEVGLLTKLVDAFALSAGFISLIIPLFFVIALGITLVLIYKSYKKNKAAQKSLIHFLFFIILIPVYVWIYVHAPYTYIHIYPNVRYALPAILLGMLMLGKIATFHKVFFRPIVFFFLASFFSYIFFILPFQSRFLSHTNDYVWFDVKLVFENPDLFLMLVGAFFGFCSVLICLFKRKWLTMVAAILVMLVFLVPFSYRSSVVRVQRGYNDEFLRGEQASNVLNAFEWVDEHLPDNAKIAYTSVGSHYHLFGKDFSREVSYVNINNCSYCLYHDFSKAENSIMTNPDFNAWMSNLKEQGKEYLIVGWKYFEDDPFELKWAKGHPENFEPLFSQGTTHIFKIHYEAR